MFSRLLGVASVLVLTALPAVACPALAGRTTYDSVFKLVGDPLAGGTWANAANGRAWMNRVLNAPANLRGLHIGLAGSDVTAQGGIIRVRVQLIDTSWKTLVDIREAVIARGMNGPGGTVLSPVTMRFPSVTVRAIRVEMAGNGWFAFDKSMFYVDGCTE